MTAILEPELAPPEYFDAAHRAAWCLVYAAVGVDAAFPSTTVEAYVVELLRWRSAERWLADNGAEITIRDDKGIVKNVITSPQLKIARDASARVEKLAASLRIRRHVA